MHLVIGMDGGGSRTRAWVARLDGTVLGHGSAGGANVYQLGAEASGRVLFDACQAAWKDAGLQVGALRELAALVAGVAGAGSSSDQQALETELKRHLGEPSLRCQVHHDLRAAHAGALAGAPGLVLVAGTGSACYGRTRDHRSARAGGWGPVLDDGGSGYWLGLEAMRAIVRAADGRGRPVSFVDAIFSALGVRSPREMLNKLRQPPPAGLDRADIARLAPLLITAAACDDPVANEIVDEGATELALMVESVLDQLGLDAHPVGRVACAGGLLENQDFYLERVDEAIKRRVPAAHIEKPGLPPVAGAVLMALELLGRPASSAVVNRLLDVMTEEDSRK